MAYLHPPVPFLIEYSKIFHKFKLLFLIEWSSSTLIKRRSTDFIEREKIAEKELEKELKKMKNNKKNYDIYHAIVDYASVREEVQFSLGMKVGAKLALMLTEDYEIDF